MIVREPQHSANAQLGYLCALFGAGLLLSRLMTGIEFWIAVLLVALLMSFGADSVIHSHWQQTRSRHYGQLLWVFPALTAAGSFLVPRLNWFDRGERIAAALVGSVILFGSVVYCQMHSLDRVDRRYRRARNTLIILAYIAAAIVFTGIYGIRARGAVSATAAGAVAFVVAIELLRGHSRETRKSLACAAVVGISVTEVAWVLNYWPIAAQAGGILLLVTLYVTSGICQISASRRLTRRDAIEFGIVGLAALSIVIGAGVLSS